MISHPVHSPEMLTSQSVIIVDTSVIKEGKLGDLKTAMKALVAFTQENEPRIISYQVHFNEDETRVTVIQVHPDPASAEFHMNVAGPAFSRFPELLRMLEIDVYGQPGGDLLEKLQRKALLLGPAKVVVYPLFAGFTRSGVSGPVIH